MTDESKSIRMLGKCRKCRKVFAQDVLRPGPEWWFTHLDGSPLDTVYCCDKVVVFSPVKGVNNPKVPCNAKCVNGKSLDCSCECGGANHGKAHVR